MQHKGAAQTNMAANFLQKSRHDSVFYFRRRVPADMLTALGKRQIYRSLHTSDRREAIIRARALAAQTDRLFASIRAMRKSSSTRTDYIVEIKLDLSGLPQTVKIEAEPGEHEAAQKALETAVAGLATLRQPVSTERPQTDKASVGPTLAEGVAEYMSKADIKPTTRAAYRTKLDYIVEQVGGTTPLFDIDQAGFVKLAETILADRTRHDKTKIGYITTISSFLNWHRIRKGLPQITAAKLKPKRTAPASLDRDAHSLEQLRVIFDHAAGYRLTEPHKYWVTVATAFLGCRVEELAQVNLHTDLKRDAKTGVWYLVFAETPDADGVLRKSLKKLSSWRNVPIHSALVRHGFIDYLIKQRDAGYSRPFESGWEPHVGKTASDGIKWSHKITKWGVDTMKELRDAGRLPHGTQTYFHSMRHTFANTLAVAKVTEEYRSTLQGQAFGGMNSLTYTKLRHDHNALSEIVEAALAPYVALLA
ncbi:hypothetical protein KTE23_02610 [Burkholderia multivorans]|uniref:DUF6538 domain-containing protein n=1 Tax=Burkholderia multivorans TaxID=87883 RepID=UPI0012DD10D9|nr:DUF6538 domain-containing protein [Burkholderia multivorans]MBU9415472.1 hypothetical protein [Burkholderia multivorans]QGR88209.1 hypothetical protein FOC34_23875 [Burkholderia multivorans]